MFECFFKARRYKSIKELKQIQRTLDCINSRLKRIEFKLYQVKKFSISLKGEEMGRLVYSVTLPEVPELDIVSQKLVVKFGDVETESFYGTDVVSVGEAFTVEEGAEVSVSLSYVDDNDNVGQPRVLSFVAEDTIAPPTPGVFGVSAVRELPDAPVDPVDPVDPVV